MSQRERRTLSEQRLLEAAIRLMAERGYEATTLADIGEAAGYSRGLATHRFGSKPALFAEVIRGVSRRWRDDVTAAVAGRVGVDALLAFVDTHRHLAEREPEILRALYVLWFQSLIAQSPMRVAAIEDLLGHRDWVQGMIERGIAAGTIRRDLDAHAEAVHLCGTLFGLTLQWLIDPAGARLGAMQDRFKERLVGELGA